jgi:hypothetical protein
MLKEWIDMLLVRKLSVKKNLQENVSPGIQTNLQ